MSPSDRDRPGGERTPRDPMLDRIRRRLERLGRSGRYLAEQVGISPSYLSLILSGQKVPTEEVAERLAAVLEGNDPHMRELYRAWATSRRHPELLERMEHMRRYERARSDPHARRRLEAGEQMPEEALRPEPRSAPSRRIAHFRPTHWEERTAVDEDGAGPEEAHLEHTSWASSVSFLASPERYKPPELARPIQLPVLRAGADPGDDPRDLDEDAVEDLVWLDLRLLGEHAAELLFAYAPGPDPDPAAWTRGHLRPGEIGIFTRETGFGSDRDAVYAVRFGQGILLSRIVFKESTIVLIPEEGQGSYEVISLEGERTVTSLLAGRLVLTIRKY